MNIHQNQTESLNGWQNIGKIVQWIRKQKTLNPTEFAVYTYIVERTVGYTQYTSDFTSIEQIKTNVGIGKNTTIKTIKSLIDQKYIIKIATNKTAYTAKIPYKYQLNMTLKNFPHLGKLHTSKEEKLKPIEPKISKLVETISAEDAHRMMNGIHERDKGSIQQDRLRSSQKYDDRYVIDYLTNTKNYNLTLDRIHDEAIYENKYIRKE